VFNTEHSFAQLGVADLHHVEYTSTESLTLESFSLAPQTGVLLMSLVLEGSDLDGLVNESGVVTMFEQSTDGDVIDTGLNTVAQTRSTLVLGDVDDYVDQSTVVGDQSLCVVGSEDFNVVALLQDGTTVGEFSVGTFNSGESLSVQNNLVSGVDLDDINTVRDGGSNDTSPCVTGVSSVESGVYCEELVASLSH